TSPPHPTTSLLSSPSCIAPSWDSPSTDSHPTLTTARGHIPLPAQRPSMKVSTVSPPPQSPPEGVGLCEIPDTMVTMGVATLLICLCGLAGNGAVLSLLRFSNRSKPITVYIFHMAITDSTFLLLIVIYTLLYLLRNDQLFLFFYDLGLYLLTAISFNRCRSIFCPLRCHCQCSQHQLVVVSAMQGAISIAVIPTLTLLFQSQDTEVYFLFLTFMYVVSLLFLASSMVMSSASLFIKAKCGSKQQKQHKRLDIVIFFMVLFALPPSFCYYLYNPVASKPFIYFSVGSCGRPWSMGSPQICLQRVLGKAEGNTATDKDEALDMAVLAC
uniref:G-protein coupled receptors family 1 profile domain-containing protein n=1 Tax=Malurus cyaneus samueli TaxID=2593467 RepID=A0A8C5X8J5_9PASS